MSIGLVYGSSIFISNYINRGASKLFNEDWMVYLLQISQTTLFKNLKCQSLCTINRMKNNPQEIQEKIDWGDTQHLSNLEKS